MRDQRRPSDGGLMTFPRWCLRVMRLWTWRPISPPRTWVSAWEARGRRVAHAASALSSETRSTASGRRTLPRRSKGRAATGRRDGCSAGKGGPGVQSGTLAHPRRRPEGRPRAPIRGPARARGLKSGVTRGHAGAWGVPAGGRKGPRAQHPGRLGVGAQTGRADGNRTLLTWLSEPSPATQ